MNIKMRSIGNSYGFSLPKEALKQAGFTLDDEYEIAVSDGAIAIVKRQPMNSSWRFTDSPLDEESREWIENEIR